MGKVKRRTRRGLRPVPASAPLSRQFVRDALRVWGLTQLTDAALLGTSELVTNAVLHAGTPIDIDITADDEKVRFAISDANCSTAFRTKTLLVLDGRNEHHGDPSATTGRGMLIVASVVDALGEVITPDGKTVWFDLLLENSRAGDLSSVTVVQEGGGVVPVASDTAIAVEFRAVPVELAVTFAQHVDGAVREAQLDDHAPHAQQLLAIVHHVRDALPQLDGFFDAAHVAGARGYQSFDAVLAIDRSASNAAALLDELVSCLDLLATLGMQTAPAVVDVGRWMARELGSQMNGGAPARCTLRATAGA